jgi:hypothetical protein
MLLMQAIAKRHEFPPQSVRRVVPMVKMDFDLPESAAGKLSQSVEDLLIIFFLGVEERMPGAPAIGIADRVDGRGISRQPIPHRTSSGHRIGAIAERLKMVTDTEDQMPGF